MWNPWRHLRDQYPGVTVHTHRCLPDGTTGMQRPDIMWLDRRLLQSERRSTLAHEIIHLERGLVPDARWRGREERAVDTIAARRLVDLDELVDALLWTRQRDELATELWLDAGMLAALVGSITDAERAWIDAELERRQG